MANATSPVVTIADVVDVINCDELGGEGECLTVVPSPDRIYVSLNQDKSDGHIAEDLGSCSFAFFCLAGYSLNKR
ncbi:hypothetical protein Q1695_016394 [Nippostrongylus brasiliensis]|nr:hypothetical protein Q1695_016394 [Nippostrongylus brasiliensis]